MPLYVLTRNRDKAEFECFLNEELDNQTVAIFYPKGDVNSEEVIVWPTDKTGRKITIEGIIFKTRKTRALKGAV